MSLRLPAEWEPQSGLLLTWPHPETDWQENLAAAEQVFIEIARHTCSQQKVIIACHNKQLKRHVENLLSEAGLPEKGWQTYIAASNDCWVRDHGPVTILNNGRPRLLDFEFNGWGGKYPAELDNQITGKLHKAGAFGLTPLQSCSFILEGGSIESDGRGTIMVTASCLLSKHRNANMDKQQIEAQLTLLLNVERILWLNHGQMQGDDTDGHIDTLARFVDPETIAYVANNDTDDPNYRELKLMAEELSELRQVNGQPYRLVPLPCPRIKKPEGQQLPASYANFLLINNTLLMPTYETTEDEQALAVISDCFPERTIIGINCRPLIEQHGSLHCVTMQLPAGVIS